MILKVIFAVWNLSIYVVKHSKNFLLSIKLIQLRFRSNPTQNILEAFCFCRFAFCRPHKKQKVISANSSKCSLFKDISNKHVSSPNTRTELYATASRAAPWWVRLSICRRDRQTRTGRPTDRLTDGRNTVTLRLPLDAASVITYLTTDH